MLKVISILSAAFIIYLIDYSTLKEKKLIKERYLFIFLLLIGIGLNVIVSLNINVPSLMDWLAIVYGPISQLVSNWLN